MKEALLHEGPVALPRVQTIADGLACSITEHVNFSIVRRYVEDVILVSDRAILEAALFLFERARVLVEPSGATSFAGLLANTQRRGRAVAVISGGNVTLQQIEEHRRALRI